VSVAVISYTDPEAAAAGALLWARR
jgi:hypothetical protein